MTVCVLNSVCISVGIVYSGQFLYSGTANFYYHGFCFIQWRVFFFVFFLCSCMGKFIPLRCGHSGVCFFFCFCMGKFIPLRMWAFGRVFFFFFLFLYARIYSGEETGRVRPCLAIPFPFSEMPFNGLHSNFTPIVGITPSFCSE
jgi:hypothetical protein